jgi:hypothetical protein
MPAKTIGSAKWRRYLNHDEIMSWNHVKGNWTKQGHGEREGANQQMVVDFDDTDHMEKIT